LVYYLVLNLRKSNLSVACVFVTRAF
jgi:hypothetical protein